MADDFRPTLIPDQERHRASHLNDGKILNLRSHFKNMDVWKFQDRRVVDYLAICGFRGPSFLKYVELDPALITALIERWRPETNTFHFSLGEMTITLQDVTILLGLRIDGDPIIQAPQVLSLRWQTYVDVCEELLGVVPPGMQPGDTTIKLSWLRNTFAPRGQALHRGSTDDEIHYVVRAYILCMLGSVLLPDTSGNYVHLQFLPLLEDFRACGHMSWRSAILGCLYRQLGKGSEGKRSDIGRCLHLLQLWSWERLHVGCTCIICDVVEIEDEDNPPLGAKWNVYTQQKIDKPEKLFRYREEIDNLRLRTQVKWEPYIEKIIKKILPNCVNEKDLWRATVPLICFSIMERHYPHQVMRQFGIHQLEPPPLAPFNKPLDARGKSKKIWVVEHATYIEQ